MNRSTLSLSSLLAVLLVCVLLVDATEAGRGTVKFNRGKPTVSEDTVRGRDGKETKLGSVVHLIGELRYTRGRGLSMDGTNIILTSETGMFPGDGALLHPRALSGKRVSVFGRRSSLGVEATLIIERNDGGVSVRNEHGPGVIPSLSDPTVGVISDAAPE